MATNSGTFSLSYDDNSFSATGSFNSSGNFGEIGTERNGSFAEEETDTRDSVVPGFGQNQTSSTEGLWNESARAENPPMFKGRVPAKLLIH